MNKMGTTPISDKKLMKTILIIIAILALFGRAYQREYGPNRLKRSIIQTIGIIIAACILAFIYDQIGLEK